MGVWTLSTALKNENDLVDMMDFGQISYLCELGVIPSLHPVGATPMTRRLAVENDVSRRRVVWFPCDEYGMPQHDTESMERVCAEIEHRETTSSRYELLLRDFVAVDWADDACVLAFYRRYGPLWRDGLWENGLREQAEPVTSDNGETESSLKRGESVYYASLQAELVSLLLRIHEVTSQTDDEEENETRSESARRLAAELREKYECEPILHHIRLAFPVPAGFCRDGLEVGFGYTGDQYSNADLPRELRRVAVQCIDPALEENVRLRLDRFTPAREENERLRLDRFTLCRKGRDNYGTPVLRYRPTNLIGLIYLLLAMFFVTPSASYVRHCPVCGDMFFPKKSHHAWHKPACRMHIERALSDRAVCTKRLSAQEKVRLYQEALHSHPRKKAAQDDP